MKNDTWIFKENSLDLIRLLAATQVCVLHSFEFMFAEKTGTPFFEFLRLFPGVPIFFFISGFLISKSYEKTPSHLQYTKNRILRIYPALYACLLINIIMVWSTGYFDTVNANFSDISKLFIAKATFLQFYNPDFMRAFGDGVLNGSLWTICVELQFYILIPVLYYLLNRKNMLNNTSLIILIVVFLLLNRLYTHLAIDYSDQVWWKLYRVSFVPWFYMFLTGTLFQRNFDKISNLMSRYSWKIFFIIYVSVAGISAYNHIEVGNNITPPLFLLLVLLVISSAYTIPASFTNHLLRGNDISYGVYIWHMPIVNQMLYYNYNTSSWHAVLAISISIIVAIFSWKLIEKPAISLKKFTLHPPVQ